MLEAGALRSRPVTQVWATPSRMALGISSKCPGVGCPVRLADVLTSGTSMPRMMNCRNGSWTTRSAKLPSSASRAGATSRPPGNTSVIGRPPGPLSLRRSHAMSGTGCAYSSSKPSASTRTKEGCPPSRPFSLYKASKASASSARQPRPHTVSVGYSTTPPAFKARTVAMASSRQGAFFRDLGATLRRWIESGTPCPALPDG